MRERTFCQGPCMNDCFAPVRTSTLSTFPSFSVYGTYIVRYGIAVPVLAYKSVTQEYSPSLRMLGLMEQFRLMTNECVDTGLENDVSSLGKLSKLCYHGLKQFGTPSYYRLTAMSRAAGILSARKKSIKRGKETKDPHARRSLLVSCYGFSIIDGVLRIPVGDCEFEEIPLNRHVLGVLSKPGLKVRSFSLNASTLSIVFSKETDLIECTSTQGIDRNVGNVSSGNEQSVDVYTGWTGSPIYIRIRGTSSFRSKRRRAHEEAHRVEVRQAQAQQDAPVHPCRHQRHNQPLKGTERSDCA